jgi:uncharacterized phage infection (PIP) family protein YhgE
MAQSQLQRNNVQKLTDDITYLQQDMLKIAALVDKLDTTIEKLTEFSNGISKLLAVHETKLGYHDKIYTDLIQEIRALRTESSNQHTKMSERITGLEKWMWTMLGASVVLGVIINLAVLIIRFFIHT